MGRVCGVLLPLPARAVFSGHVTVVDNASAVVVADISAHARAVTAIDAHPSEDTVSPAFSPSYT